MTTPTPSPQPPPLRRARRRTVVVAALIGALASGAALAQLGADRVSLRAGAAFAHSFGPPDHGHRQAAARPQICSPPNACYPAPTTTRRPASTTARRTVTTTTRRRFSFGWTFPTTTRRTVTTTTKRPTTTRRPVTTTTKRPVTTTTRRPVTTTTRRPPPTTTRRPPPTTTRRTAATTARPRTATTTTAPPRRSCGQWACEHVNAGLAKGYLPEDFNPNRDTEARDLKAIIEAYGKYDAGFNTGAALQTLSNDQLDRTAARGEMFNALAAGLGIAYDPDNPFDVADELAGMGILQGHDRDGDGVSNPYSRPDADPDSVMTNEQLAAFLNRISTNPRTGGGSRIVVNRPSNNGGDPEDEACTTGLALSGSERAMLVAQLRWATRVGLEPEGEPGRPWPPHPDVPGGSEYLLVAGSPVWPVADPEGVWQVVSDDGCLWEVISVETRLTQQLPWRPSHRAAIERADSSRPGAGFDTFLSRWGNLGAALQAQAERHHASRDVSASCEIARAMDSADSYKRCRWRLPAPGVWSWQARACFRGVAETGTFRECATLAQGLEWFLEVIDYTSGITLQPNSSGAPAAEPRRPAPVA